MEDFCFAGRFALAVSDFAFAVVIDFFVARFFAVVDIVTPLEILPLTQPAERETNYTPSHTAFAVLVLGGARASKSVGAEPNRVVDAIVF